MAADHASKTEKLTSGIASLLNDEFALPADTKKHDWRDARMQTRAREQWDPVQVAKEMLDDMEKGGRLHGRQRKST
jgi:hypothetical protein